MMFLLRLSFWLLLICLLLPGDAADNRRLIRSAGKAFEDLGGFCGRNPEVCEDARHVAKGVLVRLKSGAEMVEGWMREPGAGQSEPAADYRFDDSGLGEEAAKQRARLPQGGAQPAPLGVTVTGPRYKNSLNSADRELPWRGPQGL